MKTRFFNIAVIILITALGTRYLCQGAQTKTSKTQDLVAEVVPAASTAAILRAREIVATPPAKVHGQLVYAVTINRIPFQLYLVLHKFGATGGTGHDVTVYSLKDAGQPNRLDCVFHPQFSPDGKEILFKYGDPYDTYGGFDLYTLDIATHQVHKLTQISVIYQFALWSPDSRYVAYIRGADAKGNPDTGLQLCTFDLKTYKEKVVVENFGVPYGVVWTPQNTLLYSALPLDTKSSSQVTASPIRPNIYEVAPQEGQLKLIVEDGYRPTPSLDGKWIAFYGSEDPEQPDPLAADWLTNPRGAALSIITRDGGKRQAFTRQQESYPAVSWLPDNRHFITFATARKGTAATADVEQWDITTTLSQPWAMLRAKDFRPDLRSEVLPFFRPLNSITANAFLTVATLEFANSDTIILPMRVETLSFLNFKDQSAPQSMKLQDIFGMDWHG